MSKLNYRPDIDGLRAIAVLAVVFYHARLGMPGGYVGVDIFFVISGFLITSIMLKDIESGSFSLLSFWERRIWRIFPALFVMVLCTAIAGWRLQFVYVDEKSHSFSIWCFRHRSANFTGQITP